MVGYYIRPRHRMYEVIEVASNGRITVLRVWPTEELAISHLKALNERQEKVVLAPAPTRPNKDFGFG